MVWSFWSSGLAKGWCRLLPWVNVFKNKRLLFPQNRLAQVFVNPGEWQKEKRGRLSYRRCIKFTLFELPFESGEYRTKHDLFSYEIERLSVDLRKLGKRNATDLHDWLKKKSVELLQEQNKKPDFLIGLKVIHLFVNALKSGENL